MKNEEWMWLWMWMTIANDDWTSNGWIRCVKIPAVGKGRRGFFIVTRERIACGERVRAVAWEVFGQQLANHYESSRPDGRHTKACKHTHIGACLCHVKPRKRRWPQVYTGHAGARQQQNHWNIPILRPRDFDQIKSPSDNLDIWKILYLFYVKVIDLQTLLSKLWIIETIVYCDEIQAFSK